MFCFASQLNKTVLCACTIVESLLRGMTDEVSTYIKDTFDSIVALLKSPLAARPCSELFVSVGRKVFEDKILGEWLVVLT